MNIFWVVSSRMQTTLWTEESKVMAQPFGNVLKITLTFLSSELCCFVPTLLLLETVRDVLRRGASIHLMSMSIL